MINIDIINPFINSISKAFLAFFGKAPLVSRAVEVPIENLLTEKDFFSDISAVIALPGSIIGSLAISFEKDTALKIASALMEESFKELNRNVKDVIGEIANTVAGNIKEELSNFDFENALPNIYEGTSKKLNLPEGFKCYSVNFETEFGYFILRVSVLDDLSPRGK